MVLLTVYAGCCWTARVLVESSFVESLSLNPLVIYVFGNLEMMKDTIVGECTYVSFVMHFVDYNFFFSKAIIFRILNGICLK